MDHRTGGRGTSYAALDDSGRLTLYGADQVLIEWQSPVSGGAATSLHLEDDGTLAAYRADGRKVWGTAPTPAADKETELS